VTKQIKVVRKSKKSKKNDKLENLEAEMKNIVNEVRNDELKQKLEKKLNDAKQGKNKLSYDEE